MPFTPALQAAQEQLAYWQSECESARELGDAERIERCERFISQCELMISALMRAQRGSVEA